MRHWQKEYGMHYGSGLRVKKVLWEERFDEFITDNGIEFEEHFINQNK